MALVDQTSLLYETDKLLVYCIITVTDFDGFSRLPCFWLNPPVHSQTRKIICSPFHYHDYPLLAVIKRFISPFRGRLIGRLPPASGARSLSLSSFWVMPRSTVNISKIRTPLLWPKTRANHWSLTLFALQSIRFVVLASFNWSQRDLSASPFVRT